jgi:mRNA-degrading endonuclease toxin of MazEF toxin-antitoxin module
MPVDAARLRKGSVVIVKLDPVVGGEIGKDRACIVHQVMVEPGGSVTVLPVSTKEPTKPYPFIAFLPKGAGGLSKDSWVKCQFIRTVDISRILKHIGDLTEDELAPVSEALSFHLDLGD